MRGLSREWRARSRRGVYGLPAVPAENRLPRATGVMKNSRATVSDQATALAAAIHCCAVARLIGASRPRETDGGQVISKITPSGSGK